MVGRYCRRLAPADMPLRAGLLAAGAALVNAGLCFIGHQTGLMDDRVMAPRPNELIGLVPVLLSSIMPTLVAGGVLTLLNRFMRNPLGIFSSISLVLLVLNFANSCVGMPKISLDMGLWLCLGYVVAALLYFVHQAPQVPVMS